MDKFKNAPADIYAVMCFYYDRVAKVKVAEQKQLGRFFRILLDRSYCSIFREMLVIKTSNARYKWERKGCTYSVCRNWENEIPAPMLSESVLLSTLTPSISC